VGGAVSDKWVPQVADAVDRTISAVVLGNRNKYLNQLSSSVRDIELLGIATQGEYTLRLRQVYVEVSVLPQPLRDTAGEPFVGTLVAPGDRRTLGSFLGGVEPGVFAVIGGPGSGKTTLLRRTALEMCKRGFRTQPLPVLLSLRDHVEVILREPEPTLGSVAASVTWIAEKMSSSGAPLSNASRTSVFITLRGQQACPPKSTPRQRTAMASPAGHATWADHEQAAPASAGTHPIARRK